MVIKPNTVFIRMHLDPKSKVTPLQHHSPLEHQFRPVFALFRCLGVEAGARRRPFLVAYFAAIIAVDMTQLACILSTFRVLHYTLIAGVTAVIQVTLVIQAALLYRKRKLLRKTVGRLLRTIAKFERDSSAEEGHIKTRYVVSAILVTVAVRMGVLLSMNVFIETGAVSAGFIPKEYFFNLFEGPEGPLVVNSVFAVARHLSYCAADCFVLYYCMLCRLLAHLLRRYEGAVWRGEVGLHARVVRDVQAVDDAFCSLVFTCCSLMLIVLFMQVNIFQYFPAFVRVQFVLTGGWMLLLLVLMVEAGAGVGRAAEGVRDAALTSPTDHPGHLLRVVLTAATDTMHLTIWKIVALRRVTIVNIMGAFVTYTVILLSL